MAQAKAVEGADSRGSIGRISGVWRSLRGIADFFVAVFWFVVGVVVVLVVLAEARDDSVVVEQMSVPAELEKMGYTPTLVALQILEEWGTISHGATTTKQRPGVPESSLDPGQVEIPVPAVNISISSIVDYFKSRWNIPQRRLRGGIVAVASDAPECSAGCYTFRISLGGPGLLTVPRARPTNEIDALIKDASRLALEHIDPYLLANFYFASGDRDPLLENEIRGLLEKVLTTNPTSDDIWAHTLTGVLYNRHQQWAEALPHFDRALQIDSDFAPALNSRCWARAHIPGGAETALPDCRAALRQNDGSFQTMDSLAFALDLAGETDAAYALIRCARRVSEGNGDVEATYERLREKLRAAEQAMPTEAECAAFISTQSQ